MGKIVRGIDCKSVLVKMHVTERSIYSNRTVIYLIILLELQTVLLEYINLLCLRVFGTKVYIIKVLEYIDLFYL